MNTAPLVLDTNVARGFGEGDVDPAPFLELRNSGVSIHLGEIAAIELLNQPNTESFEWTKWLHARTALEKLLDFDKPVLLAGRLGLASNGIPAPPSFSQTSPASIDTALANSRRVWEHMHTANTLGELRRGKTVCDRGFQYQEGVNLASATDYICRSKTKWFEEFERLFFSVLESKPELRAKLPERGDSLEAIDDFIGALGEKVPSRLETMTRVYLLYFLRRIRVREPYNPKKNANDAFDLSLLPYWHSPPWFAPMTCEFTRTSSRPDANNASGLCNAATLRDPRFGIESLNCGPLTKYWNASDAPN